MSGAALSDATRKLIQRATLDAMHQYGIQSGDKLHHEFTRIALEAVAADRRLTAELRFVDLTAEQGGAEPTDAMIDAYLKANNAYWIATDNAPARDPSRWRNGNVKEATRVSLRAALTTQPQAEPRPQWHKVELRLGPQEVVFHFGTEADAKRFYATTAQPQAEPAERDKARYLKAFRHMHVRSGNDLDRCAQCKLDIRDEIHATPTAPTEPT